MDYSNSLGTYGKFRKKPVVIDAWKLPEDGNAALLGDLGRLVAKMTRDGYLITAPEGILIHTLEGDLLASPGDWIIKGVQGEYYPCKPEIFEATYERVEDE